MKSFKIIMSAFILIAIIAFSCQQQEDSKDSNKLKTDLESYQVVETINDATGIIGFDKNYNQYFINKHIEGTIDEVYILYPCVLPEEFKKVDLKVKFSGELFTSEKLPKPSIGGQKIFHINIKNIILTNN